MALRTALSSATAVASAGFLTPFSSTETVSGAGSNARQTVRSTVEPTPASFKVSERSSTPRTSRAPTPAMRSPAFNPASAAGVPGATEVRKTPCRFSISGRRHLRRPAVGDPLVERRLERLVTARAEPRLRRVPAQLEHAVAGAPAPSPSGRAASRRRDSARRCRRPLPARWPPPRPSMPATRRRSPRPARGCPKARA